MSQDAGRKTLEVVCPLCQGTLMVDAATGEVLDTEAHATASRDFDEALGGVQTAGEKREREFSRAFESEKRRGDVLEKKFHQAKKKTGSDPASCPLDDL